MRDPMRPWWMGLAAAAGAGVLWLLGHTWRVTWQGVRERERALAAGPGCIYTLWHARLLPLVFTHRGRGVAALVSRSRDGELITGTIAWLGYVAARGSSHRAGGTGARELLAHARGGRSLAVTPDGPRGPAEHVKPGLVWLAGQLGIPVLPVAAAARPALVMRSWDHFRVPLPFARVAVVYGEPITVPASLDAAGVEHWRGVIERAVAAVTARAVAAVGEREAAGTAAADRGGARA